MAFEEEFKCEIPDDIAEKIITVKDAVNFIEKKALEVFYESSSSDRNRDGHSLAYKTDDTWRG